MSGWSANESLAGWAGPRGKECDRDSLMCMLYGFEECAGTSCWGSPRCSPPTSIEFISSICCSSCAPAFPEKPTFEEKSVSLGSWKGEEGECWWEGVEHREQFGLKEGVERLGVYQTKVSLGNGDEMRKSITRTGAVAEGVSLRPSGSKDF